MLATKLDGVLKVFETAASHQQRFDGGELTCPSFPGCQDQGQTLNKGLVSARRLDFLPFPLKIENPSPVIRTRAHQPCTEICTHSLRGGFGERG